MNGTYGSTTALQTTGPKLIDDFLRRELRIGDPRSTQEVVTALRRRYAADASRLDQEAAGLPVRYDPQPPVVISAPAGDTPGGREERRVRGDLDSDFQALIEARDNREWAPEIRGWRDTLLREFADGAAAARFAQDPAMRDRSFFSVRKIGEFARVARLVGVMNLALNCDYRRLATTLDEAANVIRILMGEALYGAGLSEGGFIIQVPITDLRQRRDSLMLAVRRLSGAAEIDDDGGDWGNAVAAYRRLLDELDRRSAPELTVYLREELLGQVVDGLIGAVSRQDPEALRQVAATAPVEIARLNRLLVIAAPLAEQPPPPQPLNPISAALSYFVQSLQLFLDAFEESRSGARLIDLSVPLPMAARQSDEADREGRRILRELVSLRGEYAQEVECFLSCCGCEQTELRCQVKLDKVLFDVDRAIDLYARGEGYPPQWGDDERRAGVYSVIARNLAADRSCVAPGVAFSVLADAARASVDVMTAVVRGATALNSAPASADDVLRQHAEVYTRILHSALAASDAAGASRVAGEGLLRDLVDRGNERASLPAVPASLAPVQAQITALLTAAVETPPRVGTAILVAIAVAETGAGDSGAAAIAGVVPAAANASGAAELIRANLTLHPLPAADAAIQAATAAIRAALAAAANPVLGPNALAAASLAENAAAAADAAANPTATPGVLDRGALTAAADAAIAAAAVARAAATLQPPGAVQPVALFGVLTAIADSLDDALPLPGTEERARLITEVFEEQLSMEQEWAALVASLAPRCLGPGRNDLVLAGRELLYGNPNYRVRDLAVLPLAAPQPATRVGVQRLANDFGRIAGYVDHTVQSARRIGGIFDGVVNVPGAGQLVRDSLGAAREVTTEAVTVANETGTVNTVKQDLLQRLRDHAQAAQQAHAAPPPPAAKAPRARAGQPPQAAPAQMPPRAMPDFFPFAQKLYRVSHTRGEIQQAIRAKHITQDEWNDLLRSCDDAGIKLDAAFVRIVSDALDPSQQTEIDRDALVNVLRNVVYPRELID